MDEETFAEQLWTDRQLEAAQERYVNAENARRELLAAIVEWHEAIEANDEDFGAMRRLRQKAQKLRDIARAEIARRDG